jgi:hypothetical protein
MKSVTQEESTMIRDSLTELDQRENDGIRVSLLWNPETDDVFVAVDDERSESFSLAVAAHEALEAFRHPFASAASRPVTLPVLA